MKKTGILEKLAPTGLEKLNRDTLYHLFGFLSNRDVCQLGQVNKNLDQITLASKIWQTRVFNLISDLKPYEGFDYRSAYFIYQKRRQRILRAEKMLDIDRFVVTSWQFAALIGDWNLLKPELDKFPKDSIYIPGEELSPIHYAMTGDQKEMVKQLCVYYNVELRNLDKHHAIVYAAQACAFDVIATMIEEGCVLDLTAQDTNDVTTLQYAIRDNAQPFFEAYYRVDLMDHYDVIDEAFESGRTDFINWFVVQYQVDIPAIKALAKNSRAEELFDWLTRDEPSEDNKLAIF